MASLFLAFLALASACGSSSVLSAGTAQSLRTAAEELHGEELVDVEYGLVCGIAEVDYCVFVEPDLARETSEERWHDYSRDLDTDLPRNLATEVVNEIGAKYLEGRLRNQILLRCHVDGTDTVCTEILADIDYETNTERQLIDA